LDQELHDSIENHYQDVYFQRQQTEMNSGIYNLPLPKPLPPVRRTVTEIVNEWVDEWLTPDQQLIVMVTLMVLVQVQIIHLLYLIYDHVEEYLVGSTLRPIMNEWVDEWLTPDQQLIVMVTLMVLAQVYFILLLYLIYDHVEEYLVGSTLRPIMRALTLAKLILRQMAMIIQLNVQWFQSLAVPGEDHIQEPQI
jgi:hypothetical protein